VAWPAAMVVRESDEELQVKSNEELKIKTIFFLELK
jgi:hypothetical protein